jgi:diguanylate cyclase
VKYQESKDQSTALLRQALASMGQHDAALNPLCFAVFYERAAGINPRLNAAMDRALAAMPRLDDEAIRRLHQDFIADVGPDVAQRIETDMQRVMTDIVASANLTGQAAGAFGEQLDGLSGALAGSDTQALLHNIDATRESTQAMRDSVKALKDQVTASRGEIEALRADLLRTREEAKLCPLTRVLNRRGFDESLDEMLRVPPPTGSTHCLILLDIDHFKRVNDTHGHQVGDRVLEGLGTLLRSVPAEPGMSCARYGGEEFAILLPSSTLNKAVQMAEAVRSRTRGIRLRNRNTQTVELTVTVSAGVAAWRPGATAADLVSCADAALYRSKANGRDRVMVA